MTATGCLVPGTPAPDFALPDPSGRTVRLSDLLGHGPIVLYFYPKDNTKGCTAQACAFRDHYLVFKEAGAEVVGSAPIAARRIRASPSSTTCPSSS